ncbi:MAG: SDR family oxidoreductase [Candidatus Omnitrophica bacterium]|jgi:3-oxoacyl-[acyl-carrier protein] reductase|nr:SDR family oxidoreductase [Candidatus Omnitrophota bacterium]
MKIVSKIIRLISRSIRTAKAVRKCWRDGGVATIHVAQINYGGILKGKSVLVTGGSSGIGLAIAKKCLSEGAQVVITGRNAQKLETVAVEIHHPSLKTLNWDVSAVDQAEEQLLKAVALAGGKLDILVNNAGILSREKCFLDLTEKTWDDISAVNAKGLVFLTQAVSRLWIREKQGGKIINISSMRGFLGVLDGPYGMSKWGLVGLTRGLGLTLLPHGIIVNGVAPGVTDTNIAGIDANDNAYFEWCPPSRRVALPEEIAELTVFLMSDAANYIVGQTIICDGGYTLKV